MSQRRYTYLVKEDILLLKRRYTAFWRKAHRTFVQSGMGGLMLLSLWLTACVGEELQKPLLGEGEGYLRLQVAPVSAEISTSPLTKAVIPNEQIPKPNQCAIKITNKSTGKSTSYANSDVLPNPLVLKAGVTYTVEAYYGTDSTLQVKPYFHKREDVTVKANQSNDVTLNVSLANAMLEPVVDTNLAKHYSSWKLTASTNDKSYTFAEKDQPKTTLYAKAGETVTFTFSGTNKAEKEVSSSWDKTFKAGFAYQLQCNPNIEAFKSIEVTATATHTEDNSGNLNGTDITFSAVPNGADLDAIASWQVDVHYNNQIIRTYTGKSLSNMSYTDTGWPYIPQGSTLSASVTLKAEDKITLTNASFTSLPAPDFEVSVSAYTSYDKYLKHDITAANSYQPETMYDIQASAKIAPELLDNTNYTHSFQLLLDGDGIASSTSTTINVEKKEGLSWAAHTLKAVMTFAGSECSKESVHHITGLPYKAVPPKNTGHHPWIDQAGNNKWTDDCAQLYYSAATYPIIVSPAFHVPSNIKVGITTRIYREYYWASVSKGDLCIYQYNTSTKKENRLYQAELAREETYEPSTPLIAAMTSELPAFFIRYNYAAANGYTDVYYFNVAYQQE